MLSKVSDFAKHTEKLQLKAGLWLMYTEEIVETIARYSPNELLEIIGKLVSLYKRNVLIGNIKKLFESYKLVPLETQRIKIRKKLQQWHISPD
jgi:hypothetical protein